MGVRSGPSLSQARPPPCQPCAVQEHGTMRSGLFPPEGHAVRLRIVLFCEYLKITYRAGYVCDCIGAHVGSQRKLQLPLQMG